MPTFWKTAKLDYRFIVVITILAESWSDRPIWTHPVAVAIPDVLRSTDTALMFALGTDYNEGE